MPQAIRISAFSVVIALWACGLLSAAELIPHAQDKPPGPALSPAEAIQKMQVPEGFSVELVASEPDIVNPVAMTFDERGRVWITESLEYPRQSAGPGQDRVKVLEDTDGDGKADKFTVFADGLNIPSGIAVGHGGVWVANSPDILFLQDTDGDGKADKKEVVLTGFGRFDTHELPNSLTWGPDGWLYGINGVFNPADITYRGKNHKFTCALFRIHPKTREFEVFAEGTSNPWGVAWNHEGAAFFSACVIDHLWHITESGYYHRQGGPYPPFTSIIPSIVKHKHQKAAYCGIHFFDSDAYPAEYRDRLYMGNIHGNCLNVDVLERDGSTYFAKPKPDFLTANDAWFMPVVQKTGPDGSLYVLDWYDRYHCYQDANRDPNGIDRLKGRLYRVRYKDTPRAPKFDLAKETNEQLIARLSSPNVYYRDIAQRVLCERNLPENQAGLQTVVLDENASRKGRMHALWTLVGCGPLDSAFQQKLLAHADPSLRSWAVRAAGNSHKVDDATRGKIVSLASDPAPDVRLQVAIAARKIEGVDALPVLFDVLVNNAGDKLIPHVVWQNLHPLLEDRSDDLLKRIAERDLRKTPALEAMMPRVIERILGRKHPDPAPIVTLVTLLSQGPHADLGAAQKCLATLAAKVQSREIAGDQLAALKPRLSGIVGKVIAGPADSPLYLDAALLATSWQDPSGIDAVRKVYSAGGQPLARRLQAFDALVAARDKSLQAAVAAALADPDTQADLKGATLGSLGRLDEKWVSPVVLASYARLDSTLQPKAIVLLTQRGPWAEDLLDAIGRKEIPPSALDVNQVRKLLASSDTKLIEKVKAQWGSLRTERNPQREEVIGQMRKFIRSTSGDAKAGEAVFQKVCGQCHKMHGVGQEVGPDITVNGRSSFEQLLSNVFDPSLVIGSSYQARVVVTTDGRVLSGLLAEDSDQRVVLKIQGGKLETIARGDVDEIKVSQLSLMPEELEKQIKPQEIADLFAFITLDKHYSDPTARQLPGVKALAARETKDAAKYAEIIGDFAPGFSASSINETGMAIVDEHKGRQGVLRTHPLNQEKPCVLKSSIDVPSDKKTRVVLAVSHHADGDWRLVVKAGGKTLQETAVNSQTAPDGWLETSIDLSQFAGKKVDLELLNQATGWHNEYGFWGQIEVISQ